MTASAGLSSAASLLKHHRMRKSGPGGKRFICHCVEIHFLISPWNIPLKNAGCLVGWSDIRRDIFAFWSFHAVYTGEKGVCQKQKALQGTGIWLVSSLCVSLSLLSYTWCSTCILNTISLIKGNIFQRVDLYLWETKCCIDLQFATMCQCRH